jgi:hypothetical protein
VPYSIGSQRITPWRVTNVPDRRITPITAAVPGRPMQGETEACSGVVVLQ